MVKAIKVVATLFAVGCMGVAGWQLHAWYQEGQDAAAYTRRMPTAGGGRPNAPPTPAAPLTKLPPLAMPKSFVVRALPQPSRGSPTMTDADWAAAYPAFPHEPMDKSGFCAVPLPWRFAATPDADLDGAGAAPSDPAVAGALAFLLSYDLDWSPESYSTWHAYWVFRMAREALAGPASAVYDPGKIAAVVRGFGGTHAVGGALVRGKDGYVATLQVFDRDGKMVHEADFAKTKPFADVLGDVSADAIAFLGGKPVPPALVAHLHRPRCAKPESLVALGRVAFAEEGSAEELGAFEDVLKADPDFAEARIWRSGLSEWAADADAELEAAGAPATPSAAKRLSAARANELAAVLGKVPHPAALSRLQPELCSSRPSVEQTAGWADATEKLAGKDHPAVHAWRVRRSGDLKINSWDVALTRSTIRPFVAAAGRHPNHRGLRDALLETMPEREYLPSLAPYDPELVAALSLAAATARGPIDEDRAAHWHRVAESAEALGRPTHVLEAVERIRRDAAGAGAAFGSGSSLGFAQWVEVQRWAADAQMQLGRFDEAAMAYGSLARARANDVVRETAIELAAACSIISGRTDAVERMAADPRTTAGRSGDYLAACRKYLAGEPVSGPDFQLGHYWELKALLLAEAELAQGGDFARSDRSAVWRGLMETETLFRDRLGWLVLEQYYRRQPTLPHRTGFYEAGEWMFPDDPAVTAAVAAWRKAGGGPDLPTVDQVIANLTKKSWFMGERMPVWVPVARVRRELEGNHPDEARRMVGGLAQGYLNRKDLVSILTRRIDRAAGSTGEKP